MAYGRGECPRGRALYAPLAKAPPQCGGSGMCAKPALAEPLQGWEQLLDRLPAEGAPSGPVGGRSTTLIVNALVYCSGV